MVTKKTLQAGKAAMFFAFRKRMNEVEEKYGVCYNDNIAFVKVEGGSQNETCICKNYGICNRGR